MLQTNTKSIVIIVSILVLGLILGILSTRFLIKGRVSDFADMRNPKGFVNLFERMLDPSDEQADAVKNILDSHHERFLVLREKHLEDMRTIMDSLQSELEPHLSKDQLKRFEERMLHPNPRGLDHKPSRPGKGRFDKE
ncbi:MAG: hypothetical protein HQ510_02935 [Candidatus Marinimicrobia bacterium]|nr:hypothetical protein [Candidatus Neomarinimicrobiota bacterium]